MNKALVYDLPTRVFHVLFAGLFVGAFAIAKLTDDESAWFSWHMILGLVLFATTLFRLVWGVVGSRTARFSSLPLRPDLLLDYFRQVLTKSGRGYFAHNPASAWASLVMMALALGLGVTGILMTSGQKEAFEDIHELLANAFLFVTIAHIAGVILHQLQHRDGIGLSMIHGRKVNSENAVPLPHAQPWVALVMIGLIGTFAFHLVKNYDPGQGTLKIMGATLQLGEAGEGAGAGYGDMHDEGGGREHNDDD